MAGLLVFALVYWKQWKNDTLVTPPAVSSAAERVYGDNGFYVEGSAPEMTELVLISHEPDSEETLNALNSLGITDRTFSAAVYECSGVEKLSSPVTYYVNLPAELEKGEGTLKVYPLDGEGEEPENTFFHGGDVAWITEHAGRFLLARVDEEAGRIEEKEEEEVPPTPTPVPTQYYVNTQVNIRSGPSTDAPILGSLDRGEAVDVLDNEESPDWYRIRYEGDVAYVNSHFVEERQ